MKQSELYFMWSAEMSNPNGDMSNDNAPRYDDVDEKAIVSDVRIKRTIRDYLLSSKGIDIFINNAEIVNNKLDAKGRFNSVKKGKDGISDKDIFTSFVDNRLFGGVLPGKFQLIGTVQFGWSKSINKTSLESKQGTGAFTTNAKATKNENNAEDVSDKKQKTFRQDNYLPFAVFGTYGTINRIQVENNNTTETDIKNMIEAMWYGTKLLNTRSKEGQKPRMLMRIVYKDDSKYFIGNLSELVTMKNEDTRLVRSISESKFDFNNLLSAIDYAKNEIERVDVVLDSTMISYKEELSSINNVNFIDELDLFKGE